MAKEILTLTQEEHAWRYRDSKGRLVGFEKCTIGKYNGKTFMNTYTESKTKDGYDCLSQSELFEVTKEIKFHQSLSNSRVRVLEEIEIDTTPLDYTDVFFNMSREATFGIDESEETFKGYTFNCYWNGWECPYFTKETAMEICQAFSYKYDDKEEFRCFYDEATDTFCCEDWINDYVRETIAEPTEINTPQGKLKVYNFGLAGWTWDEIK